ncbi:hypothetical protein [Nevskia ramosa]|uniref:hypothetical protein n=1 Tax=Nevskia ramosa TaxID=64002 RepID=UPI002355E5DF|nr:hypothetical protein [Nevskia ramosa]
MSTRQFATQMKTLIEDVKSKGTAAIYCDNLIAYLREVESSPEPELTLIEIEKYKADLQSAIEVSKHTHEGQLEAFRAVINAGQNAIKSSFLLNGGASVALLAFIGHLAQFKPEKVATFGSCMLPFAFGVLAIAMTSGFTYLSQWFYAGARPLALKIGFGLNILTIVLGISSYGLFVWGLLATYRVLASYA